MQGTNYELSVNKLIILFMVNKIDMPLSNTHISEFVLNYGYTDYFSLQQYLSDLVDSNLLHAKNISHSTMYTITDDGKKTLEYFDSRIPESTMDEIIHYLMDNKLKFRDENEIIAEYYPKKSGEYIVNCIAKEKKETIIDININVVSKEQALKICENWKKNAPIIYSNILDELMKGS